MATFTAQILVGHPHQLNGGIIPTHCLFLSEGSKPVWILKSIDIMEDESNSARTVRWIPTVNNLLEDALLMIGIYVLKDKNLIQKAKSCIDDLTNPLLDLNSSISTDKLEELHAACRKLQYDYKIILSCFDGTYLQDKLRVLNQYPMEVEVCKTTYDRTYSPFGDKIIVNGNL